MTLRHARIFAHPVRGSFFYVPLQFTVVLPVTRHACPFGIGNAIDKRDACVCAALSKECQ